MLVFAGYGLFAITNYVFLDHFEDLGLDDRIILTLILDILLLFWQTILQNW